jgi:hypothetical protein
MHVEKCFYFFRGLFQLKLLVRLRENLVSTAPKPPRIPPRLANGLLLRLFQLEHAFSIRLAISVGGSLLAVGRKRAAR